MKKMLSNVCRSLFAVMLVATVTTACETTEPEVPVGDPLTKPIPVASAILENGCTITWVGVKNATTYGYTITEGEARGGAAEAGVEYTPHTGVQLTDLKPMTSYTFRVKAITKVGTEYADSEYAEIKITTKKSNLTEDPFTIEQKVLLPVGVSCKITPKSAGMAYFLVLPSRAAVEQVGSEMVYLRNYMMQFDYMSQEEWKEWAVIDMEQAEGFKSGVFQYNNLSSLYPNRTYELIVCGIDMTTRELLGYSTHIFKTPITSDVVNTFELKLHARGYNGAQCSILPSNKSATYLYELAELSKFAGLTDDKIVEMMMKDYKQQLYPQTGDITPDEGEGIWASLTPGTEYGLFVVGCVQNTPTTKLNKLLFETRKLEFKALGLSTTAVKPGSVLISARGNEWAKDFVSVSATLIPNADTVVYKAFCLPAAACDAKSDQEVGEIVFSKSNDWWNQWKVSGKYVWPLAESIVYDQDYYIVIISHGPNGVFGPVTRHKVHTTPSTTAPEPENPGGGGEVL